MLYIFDWDGTLIDSIDKIVRCMQLAARDAELEVLQASAISNIIGLGLRDALEQLYPGLEEPKVTALREAYANHFMQEDVTPCSFYPGAVEALDALMARGHQLAVATGKSRRGLDRVLSRTDMLRRFHSTRCADETASKPNPLMLEELLDEFNCNPSDALMIGDTEYDMAMAKAINMPRIAVSYGVHSVERLLPYEPEACVDNLLTLLD